MWIFSVFLSYYTFPDIYAEIYLFFNLEPKPLCSITSVYEQLEIFQILLFCKKNSLVGLVWFGMVSSLGIV